MWVFEDGCGVGAGVWGVRLGWWCGGGSFTTIIVDIEVIYRALCGILAPPKFHPSTT